MVETKGADITTVSVTLRVVTINKKQMTLSVFRQIPERYIFSFGSLGVEEELQWLIAGTPRVSAFDIDRIQNSQEVVRQFAQYYGGVGMYEGEEKRIHAVRALAHYNQWVDVAYSVVSNFKEIGVCGRPWGVVNYQGKWLLYEDDGCLYKSYLDVRTYERSLMDHKLVANIFGLIVDLSTEGQYRFLCSAPTKEDLYKAFMRHLDDRLYSALYRAGLDRLKEFSNLDQLYIAV